MKASAVMKSEAQPAGQTTPWVRTLGQLPIRLYQCTLSGFLGGQCRFTPSCSQYALEAIRAHGVFKGWGLALRRLARCQPFCRGGYDPVPTESLLPREEKGVDAIVVESRKCPG